MQELKANSTLQGGKYVIKRTLGQGGFGITYEGVQTGLGRRVAIKEFFMKDYCERDGQTSHVTAGTTAITEVVGKYREKFIKEAQMIASFDRAPHIVRIYDIFEENGTAYYVMEYVEGGSLASLVAKEGALPANRAIDLINQAGQALSYLHSHQTMHLDVKPGNILLRREEDGSDNVVLIDFGISKHYDQGGQATTTSPAAYSKGFAPIEQYREGGVQEFSPTSDVYSLGATLYFLLTAQTPPEASLLIDEPLECPYSLNEDLWQIISHAMESSRKRRWQSVDEMLQALKGVKMPESTPISKVEIVSTYPNEETIIQNSEGNGETTVIEKRPEISQRPSQIPLKNTYSIRPNRPAVPNHKPIIKQQSKIEQQSNAAKNVDIGNWLIYLAVAAFLLLVIHFVIKQYKIRTSSQIELNSTNQTNLTKEKSVNWWAIDYYMKDAQAGDTIAQRHVAFAYERENEYTEAAKWWQILADQGHPLAQRKLGKYYHDGKGVPKDLDKALYYYTKAAEQGEATAQNNLALMYKNGDGVEMNYALSAKWMKKAAESEDATFCYNMGKYYLDGIGVKKDREKAIFWLRKAAEKGYSAAIEELEKL